MRSSVKHRGADIMEEQARGTGDGGSSTHVSVLSEDVEAFVKLDGLETSTETEFKNQKLNSYAIPSRCGWFSWSKIHSIEEQSISSFFEKGSVTRTPDIYIKIRNWILKKYEANPSVKIERKDLNELDVDDSEAKQEVYEFLEHWRLINVHPLSKLERIDQNNLFLSDFVPPTTVVAPGKVDVVPLVSVSESVLSEELAKEEIRFEISNCNFCAANSAKRCSCSKQGDYELCADCNSNQKFGSDFSSSESEGLELCAVNKKNEKLGDLSDTSVLKKSHALKAQSASSSYSWRKSFTFKSPNNRKTDASINIKINRITCSIGKNFRFVQVTRFVLLLLWHLLHFIVKLCLTVSGFASCLESFLISSGLLLKHRPIDPSKIKNVAIVIESQDAHNIAMIVVLLRWFQALGARHVCLYDMEGVLKKQQDSIIKNLEAAVLFEGVVPEHKHLAVEVISLPDGKEAVAKAANAILSDPSKCSADLRESDVDEVLRALGAWGPDPDLLFVYGPARCHLGFPAWRMRYTEIVYMGPLKSMSYGSFLKAVLKFATVKQNYGK